MRWAAVKRATLLIPSGPPSDPSRKHLYVVLTDPSGPAGEVLVVCVCSIPTSNIYDPSCTLFPGEHPFVVRQSYVAYNYAQISLASHLEQQVNAGVFVAKQELDVKYMKYIEDGLLESPRASLKVKRFFASAGGT